MFFSAKSASCWLYKQAFPQHAAGLYFSSIILPNLKQQTASLTNCWTVSYNPLCLALTSEISPSPPKYTIHCHANGRDTFEQLLWSGQNYKKTCMPGQMLEVLCLVWLVGIIVVSSLLIGGDEPCWLHFRKCIFVQLRSVTGLKPPQAAFIGVQI